MILLAFLACAGLGAAIIAISQIGSLRTRIESLEAALRESGRGGDQPVVPKRSSSVPPPLPQFVTQPPPPVLSSPPRSTPAAHQRPPVNWESFVGVRMFAWIGGLAFFLGVVFFVKYAFENNLISPPIRIAASAVVGVALIAVGLLPSLRKYRIPSQSLIATGVLVLYADIYAAHSSYGLISLTVASAVMWVVTGVALALGERTDAPGILWLGLIGGFITPLLFRTAYQSSVGLFGYIGVVCCGIAAVAVIKRWPYFLLAGAVCTVVIELMWSADYFMVTDSDNWRNVFFVFQALFLVIAFWLVQTRRASSWSLTAAALAGIAPIVAFIGRSPGSLLDSWDFGLFTLAFAVVGVLALVAVHRKDAGAIATTAVIVVGVALAVTLLGEWKWWNSVFHERPDIINDSPLSIDGRMAMVGAWFIIIYLVFAATPFVCDEKKTWPWVIAAVAGLAQFPLVHHCLTDFLHLSGTPVIARPFRWLVPLGFAAPPAIGIFYLVRRRGVSLSSGDSRLATEGGALLTFVSLIFPVQFHREWITLGWALEGVGLMLLYRWLPNRRLRAVALIVFFAAFVRLALNPAVLNYHPRSHTPILNWYLYVYGIVALCLFAGGYWFGSPRERVYEKQGPTVLYGLSGFVLFLLLNIEIADYFSIGPTLTFSFAGNFARDMTYTISWSLFAFGMLLMGMIKQIRLLRFGAVALLCLALVKLFFHDLDSLSQLYRIAAFLSVAIIAIVASFTYQRFLSAPAKE